jgi:hypothetical protein
MAFMTKSGKCLISVNVAGDFNLALFDLNGRSVYRANDAGPKTYKIESGILHSGTYVARLVSGQNKSEEKILVSKY